MATNMLEDRNDQIFNIVESACLNAITPPVMAISFKLSLGCRVEVTFHVDGELPKEEREFLSYVVSDIRDNGEIFLMPRVIVKDHQKQPLSPYGKWIFVRLGVKTRK